MRHQRGHTRIFPDGLLHMESDTFSVGLPQRFYQHRQIFPGMASCTQEHGHDGDLANTLLDQLPHGRGQVGRREFQVGAAHRQAGLVGLQALLHGLDGQAPQRVA